MRSVRAQLRWHYESFRAADQIDYNRFPKWSYLINNFFFCSSIFGVTNWTIGRLTRSGDRKQMPCYGKQKYLRDRAPDWSRTIRSRYAQLHFKTERIIFWFAGGEKPHETFEGKLPWFFCLGLLNSAHQQRTSVDQIYDVKRYVVLVSFTSTLKAKSNTLMYVIESRPIMIHTTIHFNLLHTKLILI